jgi:hypothetical protein
MAGWLDAVAVDPIKPVELSKAAWTFSISCSRVDAVMEILCGSNVRLVLRI